MHIEPVLVNSDIGGTSDTTKYVDLENYAGVTFIVTLGDTFEGTATNWNVADALDNFVLVQATDAAGTSSKAITGAANAQTAVGAAGYQYALTVFAESLDEANGFQFVAATLTEDDNTGTDNIQVIAVRFGARYKYDAMEDIVNHVVTP
jgi:hypothetical protein